MLESCQSYDLQHELCLNTYTETRQQALLYQFHCGFIGVTEHLIFDNVIYISKLSMIIAFSDKKFNT